MRAISTLTFGAVLLAATSARAGDIGEALRFAQGVMGDDIVEGLEEYIERDPDEALSILVAEHEGTAKEGAPFETLGSIRLSFAQLRGAIREASRATGLPEALIDAMIRTESGYRPNAVSRVGAMGLMQLMPATARMLGVSDAFDPRQNILGGSKYLRQMIERFGSLKLAIAAYNAGPGAVVKHGGVPPYAETQRYVQVVLSRYHAARGG